MVVEVTVHGEFIPAPPAEAPGRLARVFDILRRYKDSLLTTDQVPTTITVKQTEAGPREGRGEP